MDVAELDRRLLALTPSEREYREGATFRWEGRPGADRVQTVTVDGRSMYRFVDDVVALSGGFDWEDDAGRLRLPPLAGRFAVRRNSRFNPVPEHVHDYVEMSYVYAGTCRQTVNGQELVLRQNQVLLLDTNCPHAIAAQGEGDVMLSIVISREFLRENLSASVARDNLVSQFLLSTLNEQTDHNRHVWFRSDDSRRVRLYFQELLCEYLDPSVNADEVVLRLFQLVLCELVNVYEEDYVLDECAASRTPVTPIIRYVEQNFRTCTLNGVAEHFYISPNYLSALLKRHTGMTYVQLVQAQRLDHAAALLAASDEPITAIARDCGYENMSFFYKKFEKRFGCAPKAYRERARA